MPHLLLLLHAKFGPGFVMVAACRLGMLITNAAGISALVFMWLLYPREVTFQPPLAASMRLMQVRASYCDHRQSVSVPQQASGLGVCALVLFHA